LAENVSFGVTAVPGKSKGMRLQDLVVLVAGVAILMVLPWFGYDPRNVSWFPAPLSWAWVYETSATLDEGLQRLCLVLTLLVFARRTRYGGVISATEFLIPFVALQLLLTPRAGLPVYRFMESPLLSLGCVAVCAAAALTLGFGAKRMPGWLKSALLVLMVLTFILVDYRLFELVARLVPTWGFALLAPVFAVPVMLTFTIPFAAATTQGVVHSWLGWWGVGFAWCWLFLQLAHDLANAFLSDPWEWSLVEFTSKWLMLALAFMLSIRLVRHAGSRWSRWIHSGLSDQSERITSPADRSEANPA
jgi:hypothetical protein